ncbi:MAG: ribonuclease HII [Sediminibacterium sp.]
MLPVQHQTTLTEAGVDEAGRGCFAGPVVAAAVILPSDFFHPLLNDSKQVKESDRYLLREIICKEAIAWGIGEVDVATIDHMNILRATYLAMHTAIQQLSKVPELLLIDGNRFSRYLSIPHLCMVKGDARFANIAAASILAKTFRDDIMKELAIQHPQYGFDRNKGYGTSTHRRAIEAHGLSDCHRKSFKIRSRQLPIWD